MNMRILLAATLISCSSVAYADNSLQTYHQITHGGPGLVTSPDAQKAEMQASEVWAKTGEAPAIAGSNGELLYAYGQSHPEVLSAPLHVTMVRLLPGDTGNVILSIGDSVDWLAKAVPAGNTSVIVIKPVRAGLRTNLVVSVPKTGHVYYLNLVSDKAKFVPSIGFYDPQLMVQSFQIQNAQAAAKAKEKQETTVATLGAVNPADLDFAYWWKGPKASQPLRVFSAQGHVYIQMPPDMRYRNAPALFVVENGKEQLTNYTLKGQYFVVNQLFQEARLLLGVGDHKDVVTIHAGNRPSFW